MNLLELFIKISADDKEATQALDDVESKSQSVVGKLGKGLAATAGVAAGVAVASAKIGKSFVSNAKEVAAYGDTIDKQSQKIGISAEAYQEWDAILQHSGSSVSALMPAMRTFQKQIEKNGDAFRQLGISEEQVANMSKEDLFSATITALQGITDENQRAAIATDLLGRGAIEMGALLNTSAEDTEKMRQKVHELGGVMSDDAVKAAANFKDQLQDMKTGFDSLKRNMMSEFLPALSNVMVGMSSIFTGDYDEGIDKISEALNSLVERLTEKLPDMLEVGLKILENLATAILENIPTMMPAVVDIVMDLAQMIIEHLPLLIEVGMQILVAIANGIVEALPQLIPAIVDVTMKIIDLLTQPDTLAQLIGAGIQILVAVAEGIIQALPQLIERVPHIVLAILETLAQLIPQIVAAGGQLLAALVNGLIDGLKLIPSWFVELFNAFKNGFTSLLESAKSWGSDLITNFVNGLLSRKGDVGSAIGSIAGMVAKYIHFTHPDIGPLADFDTYAPDMMQTFAKGIRDNEDVVANQMRESFDLSEDITGGIEGAADDATAGTESNGGNSDLISKIVELLQIIANKDINFDAQGIYTIVRDQNAIFKEANGGASGI